MLQPAADPGARRTARPRSRVRSRPKRRAVLVSPACFHAFSLGIREAARSAAREAGSRRAWLLVPRPAAAAQLLAVTTGRLAAAPACCSCRHICSLRRQMSPARPAPAPQGRCSGCRLALSLPLLLHSHPQSGLRQGRARTPGRRAVPGRRLRRAKCGWARATSSARPLALEPACPPGGALLPETQRPGQCLSGC